MALRRAARLMVNKATLPDLPYDYNALEPVISAEIMTLHHTKHHNAYVTNFNAALEKIDAAEDPEDVVGLHGMIKFNGGGHVNHSIFWKNLAPPSSTGGGSPSGPLAAAIDAQWGSFENFVSKFSAKTATVQGSGWGWLGYNPETKQLNIATCWDQDPLQATTGLVPLLGIDIWEHAFYLQYKNDKLAYLREIWKVINWSDVEARYLAATA